MRAGYGEVEAAFAAAHAIVALDLTIGRHTGVPIETRGGIGRYDASRAVLDTLMAPPRCRTAIAICSRICSSCPPPAFMCTSCRTWEEVLASAASWRSRGRPHLRRRHAPWPTGEMGSRTGASISSPPINRASSSIASARRSTPMAASLPSTTSTFTTRAPICAPPPRASCT